MMMRRDVGPGGGGLARAVDHNVKLLKGRALRMTNLQWPALATAQHARDLIDKAYAGKRDPYGNQWKPLRYRKEPPPTLQLTGESRASIKVTASGGHVRFYAADYLFVHMRGKHLPLRNPTPFYFRDGVWKWRAQLRQAHARRVREWIENGVVTA